MSGDLIYDFKWSLLRLEQVSVTTVLQASVVLEIVSKHADKL